ncbi:MAG: AAA family ATPase [Candidatus Methanomethylophilaceae archaeon]|nr:AAA family ATPase [Candidatus Methanomethylophilaceae archaeon]
MIQIAVYGKGGIGKSTVSANVSFILAQKGKKVLQVGCDPKHDSTRLLLGGQEQRTVLDYIRSTAPYDRKLEDILMNGSNGVRCVEAGGPEPGIGCAGRGILSTFDALKKLGVDRIDTDVRLYDVLGDVVCGGFAVPLRNEYSDAVFIVTSGEFMSIYAANNILKGLRNFDNGVPRVAGIILNSRGNEDEYETVKRFADAVGLPIVAAVPRDAVFAQAEARGCTSAELFPDSAAVGEIRKVADRIIGIMDGEVELHHPSPLTDAGLSDYAKGLPVQPQKS